MRFSVRLRLVKLKRRPFSGLEKTRRNKNTIRTSPTTKKQPHLTTQKRRPLTKNSKKKKYQKFTI